MKTQVCGERYRFGRLTWWYEESAPAFVSAAALFITAIAFALLLTPFKRARMQDGITVVTLQRVLAELGPKPSEETSRSEAEVARLQLPDLPPTDVDDLAFPDAPATSDSPDQPPRLEDMLREDSVSFDELDQALAQARGQLQHQQFGKVSAPRPKAPVHRAGSGRAAAGNVRTGWQTDYRTAARNSFQWIAEQTGGKMVQCPKASELPAVLAGTVQSAFASLRAGSGLDLALVIDTTTSMHADIGAVKEHLDTVLKDLETYQAKGCPVRVGIVLYKDYGDEFVSRSFPFTRDLQSVREQIMAIQLSGGASDIPEAVYDGIACTLRELDWRADLRTAVVIGDAPPHAPPEGSIEKSPAWLKLIARARDIQVNFYPILVGK